MGEHIYFTTMDYFINTALTIIFITIWHYKFQIPKQYTIVEGRIESYNAILTGIGGKRTYKKVTFVKMDGTRIAFKYLFLTKALSIQLGKSTPTLLAGRFCLMKQFGMTWCFAYADNKSAIALSSDMYFPNSLSKKLLNSIKYFFVAILVHIFTEPLFTVTAFIGDFHNTNNLLCFFVIYFYLLYFNFISKHPKNIYAKQTELLKQAGIPIPII